MIDSIFNNQWRLLATVTALLLILAEAGYRYGRHLHATRDDTRSSQIGGVQAAVLGLLGLLLGFTFAMAVNRYDTMVRTVVEEANAIGTSWQRAGLLPQSHRQSVKDLLRHYIELRLSYHALGNEPEKLAEGLRRSAELQAELWQHAEAAAAEAPSPLVTAFVTSLNDLSTAETARVAAARNQIPRLVWMILILVAGFGCFTSAFWSGALGARYIFTDLLLPLLISIVIILIFELTHSRQGIIRVSQQPMIDLLNSIQPKH